MTKIPVAEEISSPGLLKTTEADKNVRPTS